jgi:hypothetical protein
MSSAETVPINPEIVKDKANQILNGKKFAAFHLKEDTSIGVIINNGRHARNLWRRSTSVTLTGEAEPTDQPHEDTLIGETVEIINVPLFDRLGIRVKHKIEPLVLDSTGRFGVWQTGRNIPDLTIADDGQSVTPLKKEKFLTRLRRKRKVNSIEKIDFSGYASVLDPKLLDEEPETVREAREKYAQGANREFVVLSIHLYNIGQSAADKNRYQHADRNPYHESFYVPPVHLKQREGEAELRIQMLIGFERQPYQVSFRRDAEDFWRIFKIGNAGNLKVKMKRPNERTNGYINATRAQCDELLSVMRSIYTENASDGTDNSGDWLE